MEEMDKGTCSGDNREIREVSVRMMYEMVQGTLYANFIGKMTFECT